MRARPFVGAALLALMATLPTWAAARPVPIGRHVEVAYGLATDHPWATEGGTRRRDRRSPFAVPGHAPRRVFEVSVGGGRLFAPAVDRAGRLWAPAGAGLTGFDAHGAVLFRLEAGLASGTPSITPSGDVLAIFRGSTLLRVAPDGSAGGQALLPSGVFGSPLVLDDGSVVVVTRSGLVLRLDHGLHTAGSRSLDGAIRTSPALAPDGAIVVAAGTELVALDASLAVRMRQRLAAPVVAGPALAADGSVWLLTAQAELVGLSPNLEPRTSVRLSQRPLVAPGLGVAPDGSVRVGALGFGLAGFAADGTRLFALEGLEIARGLTVDSDGTVVALDERRELRAVAADGSLRWTVSVGMLPWAPPVIAADRTLYLVSRRGRISAWR